MDEICEVCKKEADACICPECPTCGVQGDANCYKPKPGYLRLSREQAISRQQFRVLDAEDRLNEERQYLEMLEGGSEFEDTL
jgi:hypothetical protein